MSVLLLLFHSSAGFRSYANSFQKVEVMLKQENVTGQVTLGYKLSYSKDKI